MQYIRGCTQGSLVKRRATQNQTIQATVTLAEDKTSMNFKFNV